MKIQKTVGAGVLSLGLIVGMAGFAGAMPGSGSIDTTGPRSNNQIRNRTTHRVDLRNDNDLKVVNTNHQDAWSGDATVKNATNAGSALSGNAMNSNTFSANVRVDNTASTAAALAPMESGDSSDASISDTGPRSNNEISNSVYTNVDVDNDNDLDVYNHSTQVATSGNATVKNTTNGGDATSGDASNTNSTSVTFSVSN